MSSGFVTEAELADARQKRQEEWEKVRLPDEPLEKPEEPYETRSLFERLKEQKDKKDMEFEESHKLKNLIRGLDDDEVGFLDIIDKAKMDAEKKQQIEENNELLEFRQRVASLQEQSIGQKISTETAKPKITKMSTRPSQKSILAGIVRKRAPSDSTVNANGESNVYAAAIASKVAKLAENPQRSEIKKSTIEINGSKSTVSNISIAISSTCPVVNGLSAYDEGALKCIGILPGIGKYKESSDSDKSTDTDDEYDFSEFDWMGRKVKKDCNESDCQ